MATFEDLKISKSVLKAIEELGFTEPTPIQEKAIPMIRSGVDVLGIAQTGTGKTAAYFIPLIMKLVKAEGTEPRAIVLVPTAGARHSGRRGSGRLDKIHKSPQGYCLWRCWLDQTC